MKDWPYDQASPLFRLPSEQEEAYVARVRRILPNFPDDAVRHWLFRHNSQAVRDFSWLEFGTLTFRCESWSTDKIVVDVRHTNEIGVEVEYQKCVESPHYRRSYPVLKFMNEHGTWPTAPIILDNDRGATWPDGTELKRFHAIEGMHRLGGLRALAAGAFDVGVLPQHSLWLVTGGADR